MNLRSVCAVLPLLASLALPLQLRGASKDAPETPWLIPPYILEFTGPILKLFGTNTSFGARVSLSDSSDPKSTKPATGLLLYRDGSTLFEPDSAPIRAPRAKRKDHQGDFGFLVMALAEQKTTYVISEGVSGYTQLSRGPMSAEDAAMETQELGREKVGSYDCLKRVVAISSKNGESQAFVVWSATKLRGFPVKIQRRSGGPALIFTFSDIRFERPADSLFTPPSEGYHRYESLLAMTDEMTRRVWNVISRPNPSIAYPQTRPPAAGPGTGY